MDIVEHNGLTLNILSSTIEHNEKSIELTKNELKILYYLLLNKGKIVSRVDVMEYLWDSVMFINDNTLTVNITRIRNKIANELPALDYSEVVDYLNEKGYDVNNYCEVKKYFIN